MKYKEFREYLKFNKIHIEEDKERIIASYLYEISKIEERSILILRARSEYPCDLQLLKKAIELAETPLDEREEEKKYYIKHRFINDLTAEKYINISRNGEVTLRDHLGNQYYKTKFTKAEIEELKKRFDTDLNDFELIEVED